MFREDKPDKTTTMNISFYNNVFSLLFILYLNFSLSKLLVLLKLKFNLHHLENKSK